MRTLALSLAAMILMLVGSTAQAAVVVRAGPVRVGVGRVVAPRPVAAPVVRAHRAYVRHEVRENRQEAWDNLLDAINGQ
jgi:hypothetical protein